VSWCLGGKVLFSLGEKEDFATKSPRQKRWAGSGTKKEVFLLHSQWPLGKRRMEQTIDKKTQSRISVSFIRVFVIPMVPTTRWE
jgi:hypothetical protein